MRCFLAIELSKEVRDELISIQDECKDLIKAKFVEPENLHLTLKFFRELDDEKLDEVRKSFRKIDFGKFKGNLDEIGFFPSKNFIRVLWVSVEPSEKVKKLYREIEKALENVLKEKGEKEGFESHITLARVKFIKDKIAFLDKIKKIIVKPVEFEIKEFVLKKSTLTDKGPIYEDIERFELI